MAFDTKCHDLALAFLEDGTSYDDLTAADQKKHASELAQAIQTTIEEYITFDLPKTHIEPEAA